MYCPTHIQFVASSSALHLSYSLLVSKLQCCVWFSCVKLNAMKPLHMQFGCGGTSHAECVQKLWFVVAVQNLQVPKCHHYGTSPFCVAEGITVLGSNTSLCRI